MVTLGLCAGLPLMAAAKLWIYTEQTVALCPGDPRPSPTLAGLPGFEQVRIEASPGVTLEGWYVPSTNGAVIVLLHGYDGNRGQMGPVAEGLVADGFGVLAYDLRGHGRSTAPARSFGWADTTDVTAALDYLKQKTPGSRVGIFGFSVGASVAVRAAAEHPEIFAVIADGLCPAHHRDYPQDLEPRRGKLEAARDWLEYLLIDGTLSLRLQSAIPAGVCASAVRLRDRPVLLIAARDTPGEAAHAAMIRRIVGGRAGFQSCPGRTEKPCVPMGMPIVSRLQASSEADRGRGRKVLLTDPRGARSQAAEGTPRLRPGVADASRGSSSD
jgi:pimeloyl-ACP methyl ester carboxylesterase